MILPSATGRMWLTEEVAGDLIVIRPLGELHEEISEDCPCIPAIEYPAKGIELLIHNAFDGRV